MAFPPGVSIYVKPRDDGVVEKRKGPLVSFDRSRLGNSKRGGNAVMNEMFKVPIKNLELLLHVCVRAVCVLSGGNRR